MRKKRSDLHASIQNEDVRRMILLERTILQVGGLSTHYDRDVNAADNIRNGYALYEDAIEWAPTVCFEKNWLIPVVNKG